MKQRKRKQKHRRQRASQKAASRPRRVRRLSADERDQLRFFINAPMRSAQHLMNELYADDAFYVQTTYAWVSADDAKKLFLYGICKEVFKTCIGLMSDEEVLQEIPDNEPDRMMRLITGAVTDVQTYRRRKLIELLVLLVLFERKDSRDEEYRILLSAENLDLRLGEQLDFRDLHEDRRISNTQHSIDDFVERITRDLETLGVKEIWFLDGRKLKSQTPSVFRSKKALYLEALAVATPDERLALGVSYGKGYSRTSQAVHPMLGSHDYGVPENRPRQIKTNFAFLSIVAMHVMHLAHKLAGIEDPHGITTVMGRDFEGSEAANALAAFKKDFQFGDVILTAWNDLAEVVEAHTGKFGDTAYRIRFLTSPPIPDYPEDWVPSRWITARLVGVDTARHILETSVNRGRVQKELADVGREILSRPDSELVEYVKGFFVDMHKAGALIPMLLESGFLKKNQTPD
jgi:hypothetical protein